MEDFLIIGLKFDGWAIEFTMDCIDNKIPQRLDGLKIEEMRKISLLSFKTCEEDRDGGSNKIWGTRYYGRGKYIDEV